jgi:hypothetical protein
MWLSNAVIARVLRTAGIKPQIASPAPPVAAFIRRPSRNGQDVICAQAPSRPAGRATRGRSEATSLARCRAQIEHQLRDGQRIQRGHDH